MTVYQKNGRWRMSFTIRKKHYHRAIPEATSKREAEKAETAFKADLLRERYKLNPEKSIPFKHAFEAYNNYSQACKISHDVNVYRVKQIQDFFEGMTLNEITPVLIQEFLTEIQQHKKKNGEPLANATINKTLSILSKMLSIAVDNDWLDSNPAFKVKKLRVPITMERYLSVEEQARLLEVMKGHHLEPIIIFALQTGARRSEILGLRWSEVNMREGYVNFIRTKTNKARKVPISSVLMPYLVELYNKSNSDYVFLNPKTEQPYRDIRKAFAGLLERANIQPMRFHDLRATAIVRMLSSGVDIRTTMDIVGHSEVETTLRYTRPIIEYRIKAVEALANFVK